MSIRRTSTSRRSLPNSSSASKSGRGSETAIAGEKDQQEANENKYKKYRDKLQLKQYSRAVNELLSDKYAYCNVHFLKPVDHVELNLPHYLSIVKFPMYLSTMKEALEAEEYESPSKCKKDFTMIVDAAMLFNEAGSEVHEAAKQLKKAFNVALKEAKQSIKNLKSKETAAVENEDQQETKRSKRKFEKTAVVENEGEPETKRSKKRSEKTAVVENEVQPETEEQSSSEV